MLSNKTMMKTTLQLLKGKCDMTEKKWASNFLITQLINCNFTRFLFFVIRFSLTQNHRQNPELLLCMVFNSVHLKN